MNVSRETQTRLDTYIDLLRRWNGKINLVAKQDVPQLQTRHVADSLTVLAAIDGKVSTWCDLGSGSGFPGLVIAIAAPFPLHVTLIESDLRKAAFLRTVVRTLRINVRVVAERIEASAPAGADVVSARALAPLPRLLAYAERHGTASSRYLFLKGRRFQEEIDAARRDWAFEVQVRPNKTSDEGVILDITELRRA